MMIVFMKCHPWQEEQKMFRTNYTQISDTSSPQMFSEIDAHVNKELACGRQNDEIPVDWAHTGYVSYYILTGSCNACIQIEHRLQQSFCLDQFFNPRT